jgi:hypothetical protein
MNAEGEEPGFRFRRFVEEKKPTFLDIKVIFDLVSPESQNYLKN